MGKFRRISKQYGLKQIVTLFVVCCMFCNPAVLAEVVLTGQEPGGSITVSPLGIGTTQSMTAGNGDIGYFSDFDILNGHTVNCVQGGANNNALFKVNSLDGTQIYGKFNSDGNIYLQDIRGIFIGPNGEFNANQSVLSTLNIDNGDWQDFITGIADQLPFARGSGDPISSVENEGAITALTNVYLVGSSVINRGTVTASDLVVMAAGENVYLKQNGSNVVVEVSVSQGYTRPYDRVVDNGGSQGTGAGTITANDGKVILAAGDIYSTAIEGIESLRAEATGDITLNGAIGATGHVEILGGQNRIISRHAQININDDITAGSMRIKNGKDVEPGEESLSGIYVAEGKNLTAEYGDVVVEAVHNVVLGGDVSASGDVFINGDEDGWGNPKGDPEDYNPRPYGGGDVIANNITAGGNVDIKGNAIQLNGDVSADGDLTITGRTSKDNYTDLDFSERGLGVEWGYIDVAPETMLWAGHDVILIDAFGSGGDEEPSAGEMDLFGHGGLAITADGGSIQTQGPFGEGVKITVENSSPAFLGMLQADSLNLADYSFGNQNNTDLYLESSNGSVTAVDSSQSLSGKNENAADQWASIEAYANTDITLQGHDLERDIKVVELHSYADDPYTGNISVTSDNRKVQIVGGGLFSKDGDVIADNGSISLTAINPDNGGIETVGDILASDGITLHGEVTANGEGDQTFDAGVGTLWAKDTLSTITKTTAGGLTLGGDTLVNLDGIDGSTGDSVWVQDGFLTITDSVDVEGNLKAKGVIHLQGTTNNVAGDILSTGSGILIDHDVDADGVGDQVFDAGTGQLIAENEADIDKSTAGSLTLAGDTGIVLGGNVTGTGMTAVDSLIFENNVTADGTGAAQDQRLDAGLGALDADGSIAKTSDGKLNLGGAEGIELGGNVETHDGDLTFEDAVTANGGDQVFDAGTAWHSWGNDLVAADDIIKTTDGSLTLDGGRGDTESEIYLAGNVETHDGDLILKDKVVANGTGDQSLDAGTAWHSWGNDLIAEQDIIKTTDGSLTLDGGRDDVDSEIYLAGDVKTTNGDLTFEDKVIADGSGNQRFDAIGGKLLAQESITKTTTGNLDMFGGYNGPLYPDMDYSVHTQAVTVDDGELSIAGNATVRLDGSIYSKGKMTLAANADGILSTPSSPTSTPPLVSYDNLIHNSGTIQSLNGDVDLSGINIALNGGSNPTDAYVSAGGDILIRNYTWVQYSRKLDAGDDIVLAEGKRLQGNGSLSLVAGDDIIIGSTDVDNHWLAPEDDTGFDSKVKANGDLILNAVDDVYVHGELITLDGSGGDIEITASDDTIHLYGNVTADQTDGGDIILHANTEVADGVTLDAGDDVVLAGGKSITGNGNLTLEAGDDILLGISGVANHWLNQGVGSGGDVSANGDLILTAGDDVYAHGDLTATGDITVSSSDDTINLLGDKVEATGNVNLQNNTVAADGILIKAVQGDVVVGKEEQLIGGETYYTDASLTGNGALTVEAGSDIVVGGDMETYGDTLLTAADSISVGSAYTEGGDLGMTATNGNITSGNLKPVYNFNTDGDLVHFGGGIEVDGGDMTLSAENGNISFKYAWAWENEEGGNMDMTAGGDITAGVIAPAIEIRNPQGTLKASFDEVVEIHQGGAIEATGDMTLLAGSDITATWINWQWNSDGEVYLDAGHDILIGGVVPRLWGWHANTSGNWINSGLLGTTAEDVLDIYVGGYIGSGEGMTLLAGNDIKLGHAQASQSYYSGPDDIIMDAGRDILVGGLNPYAVEVDTDVYETRDFDRGGRIEADLGAITLSAGRDISLKMAEAKDDITMTAVDNITLRTNQPHPSSGAKADRTESYDGDIRLHALNGDISIAEGYELIAGEFYYDGEVATGGGVSLIADNGKIYSPGGDDDTLNIYVEGSSSQLHDIGVELPSDPDQKAAIVIISKEDLKLGEGSELSAFGTYDTTGAVDDRAAIDFLADPLTTIGGVIRDEGEPFDVAVYLASTEGDVDVSSPVTIGEWDQREVFVPEGTMVIDAWNAVTFDGSVPGGMFETSLADGAVGDRLEVVSRTSEWLYEAIGRLPYVYGGGPFPTDYSYVLRGAGLGNPLITDGRAWVLEDPLDPAPLYQEAGEKADDQDLGEGGCPALMNWLANEIGVPAEDIQVALSGALALNTDIQPCEMCARLMGASKTLEDVEGTQIAAMARVVNEFVTTPAPPSPEQMTSIAAALALHVGDGSFYASAGQWIDALVAYVGIMNSEMGYSASDSAAFAQKYLTPVTETGNVTLTAYVTARLAALGG
jgi:filamentous hemagglutinin